MKTYSSQIQLASAFAEHRTVVVGDAAIIGNVEKKESAVYWEDHMIAMKIGEKQYFSLCNVHQTALNRRLNTIACRLGYGEPFSLRDYWTNYGPVRLDSWEMYDFDQLKKYCPEGSGQEYDLLVTDSDHLVLVRHHKRIGEALTTPLAEAWRNRAESKVAA